MRRFWKTAQAVPGDGAWGIELDGKPLRTPARAPLVVPTEALARAIAEEWAGAPEQFEPRSMPLTGLANAAVDRVAPDPAAFGNGLAEYGECDLTCYRAEGPRALVSAQEQAWDPLLEWARRRFDVDFRTTCGIVHVAQPSTTTAHLAHAVAALKPFQLAGLSPLVTIGGSLVAALAVLEGAVTVAEAWEAVSVDDRWQLQQWGSDSEAEERLANRRLDFFAAASFLQLLES
ncbi:MAG: ATPase [Pseudomonadota bacterium]|nr:ATPase [Sphingomonas sp.]MDQ3477616.1 ATPase [Pseudomonadota bacterium]